MKDLFLDNCEEMFSLVFPNEIPEDISLTDPNWHHELADLNPKDTSEIAQFDNIVEGWTTWLQSTYYYVTSVPDREGLFLLFQIDWDGNWETWERVPLLVVKSGKPQSLVSKILLRKFAEKRLPSSGEGDWHDFLKKIIADNGSL